MPVSAEFQKLDDERRAIQARIQARATLRKKADKLSFMETLKLQDLVRGFDVHEDAVRYVDIQDREWELWGITLHSSHRADHVLPE